MEFVALHSQNSDILIFNEHHKKLIKMVFVPDEQATTT